MLERNILYEECGYVLNQIFTEKAICKNTQQGKDFLARSVEKHFLLSRISKDIYKNTQQRNHFLFKYVDKHFIMLPVSKLTCKNTKRRTHFLDNSVKFKGTHVYTHRNETIFLQSMWISFYNRFYFNGIRMNTSRVTLSLPNFMDQHFQKL